MTLAPRRFPETITRRRQSAGGSQQRGRVGPGSRDRDRTCRFRPTARPGGLRHRRRRVFGRADQGLHPGAEYALAAAFDDGEADRVIYGGREFVVEESRSWPGSHTRATLLRET